jgi:hypothetical protein
MEVPERRFFARFELLQQSTDLIEAGDGSAFNIAWSNNQGASGFTGLTLHATAAGKPTASLTLAGFTTDDMNNGRISVTFGHDSASGSSFMNVHSNS